MNHMRVHHHVIGISLLVAWLVPAAHAQPLEIENPGFEAVKLADDEFLAGQLGDDPSSLLELQKRRPGCCGALGRWRLAIVHLAGQAPCGRRDYSG